MQLAITFLEGAASFVSPCVLPMLPVYVSYFGGAEGRRRDIFIRSLAFVAGFTIVFCALGVFAGTLGSMLMRHMRIVSAVCGGVMVVLGLCYLGVIRLSIFKGSGRAVEVRGIASAMLFGAVFSVSMTPCAGPMLGAALMLAGSEGGAARGALLLASYSLGLGLPLVLSAMFLDGLKGAFAFIQSRSSIITRICGGALIVIGVYTAMYY